MVIFLWLLPVVFFWQQGVSYYERAPNGAQIVAHIRPSAPYCVASLFVKSGSAYDPINCEGTAHLLEHLLPIQPHGEVTLQIALDEKAFYFCQKLGATLWRFTFKG